MCGHQRHNSTDLFGLLYALSVSGKSKMGTSKLMTVLNDLTEPTNSFVLHTVRCKIYLLTYFNGESKMTEYEREFCVYQLVYEIALTLQGLCLCNLGQAVQ